MAQVVGRACAICAERIATVAQGEFCSACRAPVHLECARRAAKGAGGCAACGAPERPAEPDPSLAPPRASPGRIRKAGIAAVAFGVLLVLLFRDFRFRFGLPVPWLGWPLIGFGLLMVAFPSAFESWLTPMWDSARTRWIPAPAPAQAASAGAAAGRTFEGAYEPPLFTGELRPFPLRGKGSLAIRAGGLEATGARRAIGSAPGFVLLAVAIPALCAAVGLVAGVRWLAVVLCILVACAILRRLRRRPSTVTIPWEKVHGFLEDPNGRVLRIAVRGMKPGGEIWFAPADGPAPLLVALMERGLPKESGELGL